MFAHRELRVGIGVAVTDRHGGVSAAPWDTLNLADHVGDEQAAVHENRARVTGALGTGPIVAMRQVHGAAVAVVDAATTAPPEADAVVTREAGLALLVQVADCTPLLLWDRRARVVAAVHVGRRGLAAGVVPAAIEAMCGLRARPQRCVAVVGPGICPEHYEVPGAMRTDVARAVPAAEATTSAGAPALDIRAGVLAQLHEAGLRQWTVLPRCTAETDGLYSHRRDGVTGRFGGLVWMQP